MTDTKLTDLPQAPTEWEPTPHLRWKHREMSTIILPAELQQKWVEWHEFDISDGVTSTGRYRRTTGREEWRAVPTEDQ